MRASCIKEVFVSVSNRNIIIALLGCHLIVVLYMAINWLSYNCFVGDEGALMTWAYQFSHGLPLYGVRANPELQDLFAYTPLASQIYGTIFKLCPFDVRWMRLVNFLFSVGGATLVGLITFSLCRCRFMAVVSGGLMLASPPLLWFIDCGPNEIHVFFALLGMYFLIRESSPGWKSIVIGVLALFASFWAKQTGAPYLVAGLVYLLGAHGKKGLAACGIALVIAAGFLGYYALKYSGTMYNMFVLQAQHPILGGRLWNPVLFPEILGRFGVLLAVILAGVGTIHGWKFKNLFRPELLFLGAAGVVGIIGPLKYGSGTTQTIVFYGMILACGIAFLKQLLDKKAITEKVLVGLLIVQMILLAQDPRMNLWRDCYQARFDELCRIVATPGKSVLYSDNPVISLLVNKPYYAGPGRDCYVNGKIDRSRYPKELSAFFKSDPFDMIVIDVPLEDNSWPLYERLNVSYQPVAELPALPGDPNMRKNFKKVIFMRKDQVKNKP